MKCWRNKQKNVPSIKTYGLVILFYGLFSSSLRRCDYHLHLLWGLGHCQDMNVKFQFKNILWNTFSYFKIYLLFPWNRVLDFLILPFRSEISLNNWGLEKSYNTAVFSPSPRRSLHANTHWRQYNLGEVLFFFFSVTGNWGVEVVGWGARDCVWVLGWVDCDAIWNVMLF